MCNDPKGVASELLDILSHRPDMDDIQPIRRTAFVLHKDRTVTYAWVAPLQLETIPTDEVGPLSNGCRSERLVCCLLPYQSRYEVRAV